MDEDDAELMLLQISIPFIIFMPEMIAGQTDVSGQQITCMQHCNNEADANVNIITSTRLLIYWLHDEGTGTLITEADEITFITIRWIC